MAIRSLLHTVLFAACAAGSATAACLSDTQVTALHAAYSAGQPAANPEGLSAADGECTRTKFNRLLSFQLGEPVGYKAGLTNPAVQKRFNHDAPVWGMLYANMLLADGATVDPAFGARPLFEADMLVRVSSTAVNAALTPADVIRSIDQVIPFIELPDLVVQAPPRLNGAARPAPLAAAMVSNRSTTSARNSSVPNPRTGGATRSSRASPIFRISRTVI